MNRTQSDWMSLEDLRVRSFLKIAFVLSGFAMALGLLAFSLTENGGFATFVFLAILIVGIGARIVEDRRIIRAFRERPGVPVEQLVKDVKRKSMERFGRSRGFGKLTGAAYVALAVLIIIAWDLKLWSLSLLLLAMLSAPYSLLLQLIRTGLTATPAPDQQAAGRRASVLARTAGRPLLVSIALVHTLTLAAALIAISIILARSADGLDSLRTLYFILAAAQALWGGGIWLASGVRGAPGLPRRPIVRLLVPTVLASALFLLIFGLTWPI